MDELNSLSLFTIQDYSSESNKFYTAQSFWKKIKSSTVSASRMGVKKALTLYFCMMDSNSNTPQWAKATIVGALGYFILPNDLIMDTVPIVGYSDDWRILFAAYLMVEAHVKPEHEKKADENLRGWFSSLLDTTSKLDKEKG